MIISKWVNIQKLIISETMEYSINRKSCFGVLQGGWMKAVAARTSIGEENKLNQSMILWKLRGTLLSAGVHPETRGTTCNIMRIQTLRNRNDLVVLPFSWETDEDGAGGPSQTYNEMNSARPRVSFCWTTIESCLWLSFKISKFKVASSATGFDRKRWETTTRP